MSDDLDKVLANKKKKDAELRKKADLRKRMEKAACECFSSEGGKTMLGYLLRECGFHAPSVIVDPTSREINKESTVYNEARRDVYLRVRALLKSRPDILAEVELNFKGEKA